MAGMFITFEGSEGGGKSTQAQLLKEYLENKGYKVKLFREPGGTRISEKIRKILLDPNEKITPLAELFLYLAARAQLVKEEIKPALEKGCIVIGDRFIDSTTAYQGWGRNIDVQLIKKMNKLVTGNIIPDLTLVFQVENPLGFKKKATDRLEKESASFHRRVQEGYLKIAQQEPDRVKIIPVKEGIEAIQKKVREIVDKRLIVDSKGS